MSLTRIQKTITGDGPGRSTELTYFTLGPDTASNKVYLQAALHADEQPGIMVLHHLLPLLTQADDAGLLNARFVIFPMVNPLGMADISLNQHQGRHDKVSGVNHNRQWPDLFHAIEHRLDGNWSGDVEENRQIIRRAVAEWLADVIPVSALQQQKQMVMQEAYDADYVFDLHCDNDALVHIFSVPQINSVMQDLSHWIGAAGVLTAEDSGGGSFDEVWPGLWIKLAAAFPGVPLPEPAIAATLEYRGQFDTFDALNGDDAHRLYGFFQEQGLIGGEWIMAKPDDGAAPTPLNATEMTRVTESGLLAYRVALGDEVEKGDVLADLIALDGDEAFTRRTPIVAGTSGRVISRNIHKYVWPGCSIAKIVGTEPLPSRGDYLLED
ncbi:MAG: succinylglutamate desuccinylase/aspartoacylase family protein [Thiolinea sp.]